MTQAVLLALFLSCAIGAVLLGLGLRGRRLDRHPVCRDCGFDLSGFLSATPAGITCPECGAGLKRSKALRIGQRRPRPMMTIAGVALLLTGLVPGVVLAGAMLASADLHRQKPVWLLTFELRRSSDAIASKRIADELMTRMLASALTRGETDQVVAAVLEVQGDTTRPWDESIGELIEQARLAGTISPADEQVFFDQAAIFELRVRPRADVSQPLPVSIELSQHRVGTSSTIHVYADIQSLRLNGRALERAHGHRTRAPIIEFDMQGVPIVAAREQTPFISFLLRGSSASPSNFSNIATGVLRWYRLTSEDVTSHGDLVADVRFVATVPSRTTPVRFDPSNLTTTDGAILTERVQVLAAPAEPVMISAQDAAAESELRQKLLANASVTTQKKISAVTVSFNRGPWRSDLCFDVFIKCNGMQPFLLGQLHARADGPKGPYVGGPPIVGSTTISISAPIRNFTFQSFDVILKPRPDIAAQTPDLREIFGQELIFRDVRVEP